MNGIDILRDAASRPLDAAEALRDKLDAETLNAHVGGHPNSVAWLLWHAGREIDAQLADLADHQELWVSEDFAELTGFGEEGSRVGYGDSAEQARAVTAEEPGPLLEYLSAVTEALLAYLDTLDEDALGDVIDDSWDPPVTRGARLVSIVDDAAQHVGQAAYVVGVPEKA
ncbi:DinB family protein [Brachybacterium sp. GCM10030267]|uniref:mycothiol transferase n=1 Tax=Brachybacterium sp. GCM10030267 TaxID=3273381 RepID=UPI00361A95C9